MANAERPVIAPLTIGLDRVALTRPTTILHGDWCEAVAEFALMNQFHHGSGLSSGKHGMSRAGVWKPEQLQDSDRFAGFVDFLRSCADESFCRPLGLVPDSKFWITGPDQTGLSRYLGALSLRHELDDLLLEHGGHIGYGVRPSAAGQGVATRALQLALARARALGLDRVLVTCEETNPASERVIVKCGGVLEDARKGVRRFWIDL